MKNLIVFFFALIFIVIVDQILLFKGTVFHKNHTFYCRYFKNCNVSSPFRYHPYHGFLVDPSRPQALLHHIGAQNVEEVLSQIDEGGFRNQSPTEKREYTINVFGDSFVFGYPLALKDTFINHLNRESKTCYFRNYGVMGYSLEQMYGLSKDATLVPPADEELFLGITDDIYRVGRIYTPLPFQRPNSFWKIKEIVHGRKDLLRFPVSLVSHSFFFYKLYHFLFHRYFNDESAKDYMIFFENRLAKKV